MKKNEFSNEHGKGTVYTLDHEGGAEVTVQGINPYTINKDGKCLEHTEVMFLIHGFDYENEALDNGSIPITISKDEAYRLSEVLLSIANNLD